MELDVLLSEAFPTSGENVGPAQLAAFTWKEVRLFLSSSFIDTHAERDVLIKRVIPNVNRQLAPNFIRIVPVDLRWGVLKDEAQDCHAIQRTCLNQIDKCRQDLDECPWFLGLRTERYGWVQDQLLSSEGFDNPQKYEWVKTLQEYNKSVSITSLECIHAIMPPKRKRRAPNIFCYKRNITNWDDVEEDMRWIFDFEYVPKNKEFEGDIQYQYVKTKDAAVYKKDKDCLDRYLENSNNVKYSSYECHYEKGNAVYTAKNKGRKSFGIGRVSGLERFEEEVEKDLLHAIREHFVAADIQDIPEYTFDTIQHENAVKLKASTFVGRSKLYSLTMKHCLSANRVESEHGDRQILTKDECTQNIDSSVVIIHGEPGCGKSALLAAVSAKCLQEARDNGDFVFVHAVDSCPGSNNLEEVLRRLQFNLRKYRGGLDEAWCTQLYYETTAELKKNHVYFLEQSAAQYPNKRFLVLIDAVNQLYGSLQAWKMWWLPSKNAPSNLRVIISTLNLENGTFRNACEICPNARLIPVEEMSYDDGADMVTGILKRFNKKLTTVDDSFLGNQMDNLLRKNKSPLYLVSATEALRKFGIYEKISEYIRSFPNGISEMFNFLLEEWSTECGKQFVEDVTGLLCLSKDGLLENEINDMLRFKEESQQGFFYDCSFSRFYDSLSSFLAAGGGGYLRFFHDQMKYEVKKKFVTPKVEQQLHTWLIDFYLKCIQLLLCEFPSENPPTYYEDCLKQVVHHQLKLATTTQETARDFTFTLRNIYFVRERVKCGQGDLLQQEYIEAIRICKNDKDRKERKALKDWAKFTQLYRPHIKKFPEWAHNMAVNQHTKSYVAIDTISKHEEPVGRYAWYWCNMPTSEEDPIEIKYTTDDSYSCTASTRDENLCCVGGVGKFRLYEADTGVIIHEVEMDAHTSITSVYISTKSKAVFVGYDYGRVSVWSIETGMEVWNERFFFSSGGVRFIANFGDYVACGMTTVREDNTTIAIVDEEKHDVIKRWSTEAACFCYGFHRNENMILSGHKGVIKCWSIDGCLDKEIEVGGPYKVQSLSASPNENHIVMSLEYNYQCCIKQMSFSSGEQVYSTIHRAGGPVLYDESGKRIVCTGNDSDITHMNIMLYTVEGHLLNKIKGYNDRIESMCLVQDSNDLLVAGKGGSRLFNLPSTPDQTIPKSDEEIMWCEFVLGGAQFATLSMSGKLSLWDIHSPSEPLISRDVERESSAMVHTDGNHIIVYNSLGGSLHWLSLWNLETMSTCNIFGDINDDIDDINNDIYGDVNDDIDDINNDIHGDINDDDINNDFGMSLDDILNNLENNIKDTNDTNIEYICISPNGFKCIVVTIETDKKGLAFVFDITDSHKLKQCDVSYEMNCPIESTDVHSDNVRVVSGGTHGTHLWNMITGETIRRFDDIRTFDVRFLTNQDKILYVLYEGGNNTRIMDIYGEHLITFDSKHPHTFDSQLQFVLADLKEGTQVITAEDDNSIRVNDTSTGKVVYTFIQHLSQGFERLAVHPSSNMMIAKNGNGMFYIFKNSRNVNEQ